MGIAEDIAALTPGQWYEIAGSNLRPSMYPWAIVPGLGLNYFIDSWSGGTFDKNGNRLLLWGGGHEGYGGNEIYGFSFDTFTWDRVTDPSSYATILAHTNTGGYYSDGLPVARHTYHHFSFDAENNYLYSAGGYGTWRAGWGTNAFDRLDMRTKVWTVASELPVAPGSGVACGVVDPINGHVWWTENQGSHRWWYEWNPKSPASWVQRTTTAFMPAAETGYSRAAIHPNLRKIIKVGATYYGSWNITASGTMVTSTLSASGPQNVVTEQHATLALNTRDGRFYSWIGGSTVYRLDANTDTFSAISGTGTPGAAHVNGDFGRWQYVPALDVFCVVTSIDRNVWVWKPPSDAVLKVGPGKTYATLQAALNVAQPGDCIEIDAGTYTGAAALGIVNDAGITIRGVGGLARLSYDASLPGANLGIITQQADNLTLEYLEISDADDYPSDGGVRNNYVGGNSANPLAKGLICRHCYIHDCDQGILYGTGGALLDCIVRLEYCRFSRCGRISGGQSHNLYIGHVTDFIMEYCYSTDCYAGHLVKTRAENNWIRYNRISDEAGISSEEIDISQGGHSYVIGNMFYKGTTTESSSMINYGSNPSTPGVYNTGRTLYVINNTAYNPLKGTVSPTSFLRVYAVACDTLVCRNNLLIGQADIRWNVPGTGFVDAVPLNCVKTSVDPGLTDLAGYDWRPLVTATTLIDQGSAPGVANYVKLTPGWEYVHTAGRKSRIVSTLDIGAFEYEGAAPPTTPLPPTNFRMLN